MKKIKHVLLGFLVNGVSYSVFDPKPASSATCILTSQDPGSGILEVLTINDDLSGGSGSSSNNTICGAGAAVGGSTTSNNTAVGVGSTAGVSGSLTSGANNTAIGSSASAGNLSSSTSNNLAVGSSATANGGGAVALGNGATANFANSVAIGTNATTTRANQIVLGTSSSSYTLPGLASNGSFSGRANQSGEAQIVTVDGSGNLGTASLNNIYDALTTINNQIENVGALAAALSSIPNLTTDGQKYGCGIGTGGYGSGWSGAAGCATKLARNVWMNGAIAFTGANSTAWGSTSSVSGRLGLFVQWGGPEKATKK